MLRLSALGANIVLHVHDEAVVEVDADKAEAARQKMQEIMRTPPEWAAGFPLWADCGIMKRYGKG
jgi:DNA polymerase I-like protein with 3'-5' exonuclease and polymerase domains